MGERKRMFVEIGAFESELESITRNFPRLVDTRKGKSGSDPMVIALAMSKQLSVVSGENGGSEKSTKISYACDQLDLRHISLLSLFRDQRWSF